MRDNLAIVRTDSRFAEELMLGNTHNTCINLVARYINRRPQTVTLNII